MGQQIWLWNLPSDAQLSSLPVYQNSIFYGKCALRNLRWRRFSSAYLVWGQEDRTTVIGRDGALRATGPSLNEQTVQIWTEAGNAVAQLEGCWFDNGFEGTMGELLCAIEEDRQPSHSAANVLRSLELCFAALESADRKAPVRPGDVRSIPKKEPGGKPTG